MDGSALTLPATRPAAQPAGAADARAKQHAKQHAKARHAAEEFEAVFLTTMLEGMFNGIETKPPFGGGETEKTYRGMLVGEYAKELSGTGGIGIAEHVYREILAAQEGVTP